jgi:tetratricopeptide (TPR) repeat protein
MRCKSLWIWTVWCACAAGASPMLMEGVDALKRGDFAAAETKLRAEIRAHPDDVEGLSFLGVALDNQKQFAEAESFHRRALALAPRSNSILDKYGNHLLVTGDEAGARKTFLKSLTLDPADGYANLQLAQLALKDKDGPEALKYLDRLSAEQSGKPDVAIMRLVALELSGRSAEAGILTAEFRHDAEWNAAAGRALADAGVAGGAETLLENALAANPASFSVLVVLGVVASHTGHYERSREVLEAALRQQPRNADALYSLAYMYDATQRTADAFRLLTEAAKEAPGRPDIQRSFAIAAGNLGEFKIAADAWDAYIRLNPADDTGRRERGFATSHLGQPEAGIADLRWYAARHPDDAEVWYELGIAESAKDPATGMSSLDRAIALRPDFAAARSVRGALYYREGKPETALPDLERAAADQPDSAMIQYRLGQVYLALDRLSDALRYFRRAAELAPDDYPAQFHLANALAEAGQTAESDAIMERIRNWPVRRDVSSMELPDRLTSGGGNVTPR